MKDNTLLLGGIALALGAGYVLMRNRQPIFYPSGPMAPGQQMANVRVKLGGITFENNDLVINFMVQNPNSQPMEIMSFVGDFLANGNKFGEVQMFGDYVVRDNTQLSIPVVIKVTDKAIRNLIATRKAGIKFSFRGIMNVNRIPVPVTLQ